MLIPYTSTHSLPREQYVPYVHPVQYVKDTHGQSDPEKYEYYKEVYDLDVMIEWWDAHGTFPKTKDILDCNHIDNVQWDGLYNQNVKDTRQMLRELLGKPHDGLMRPERLLRDNPTYYFTVEAEPPSLTPSQQPKAQRHSPA